MQQNFHAQIEDLEKYINFKRNIIAYTDLKSFDFVLTTHLGQDRGNGIC